VNAFDFDTAKRRRVSLGKRYVRRGAFSLCRGSNAFALIFMLSQLEKNAD